MYKINCLNPISSVGLELLSDQYEISDTLDNADAALVRSASMHDTEVQESLLAVARAGAGVNNIPYEEYAKKGICVFNTPGANANGVKELVVAGLMLAARDIVGGINWVTEHAADPDIAKSVEKAKSQFAGTEVKGKKIAIIGLGAIGVIVANAANRLGMDVYGYDPYLSVKAAFNLNRSIHYIKSLDDAFANSDYISLHLPLLPETKGIINQATLDKMKDGVKILNFSRDLLVNDDDMLKAIESGKVSRYVTDFPNAKTAGVPHIVAIPHLGASTEEAEDNCAKMAVDQIMDYIENGNIVNSVNYPDCEMGVCGTACRICIIHDNIANMLSQFTTLLAAENINIVDMTNKSRNREWGYTMMDLDSIPSEDTVQKLKNVAHVVKVRILKG